MTVTLVGDPFPLSLTDARAFANFVTRISLSRCPSLFLNENFRSQCNYLGLLAVDGKFRGCPNVGANQRQNQWLLGVVRLFTGWNQIVRRRR